MSKITKEDLDYICDVLVKAFTVDRHIAVEPDAINEIRRLARLGLLLKQYRGTVMNSLTMVLSELPKELTGPERELYKQLLAMKEAQ